MSLLFNMPPSLTSFSSKEQMSFNFMAAVTICSDFEVQKIKSVLFPLFLHLFCHEVMGLDAMISAFWMLSFKPAFSIDVYKLIWARKSSQDYLPYIFISFLFFFFVILRVPCFFLRSIQCLSVSTQWDYLTLCLISVRKFSLLKITLLSKNIMF